jgi:hypothetical protein
MNLRGRTVRKAVALLTALAMMFSLAVAGATNVQLTDIQGHWAEEEINKWVSLGLAKGTPEGRFNPNDEITRAEFVTFVNRVFNYVEKSDYTFDDVSENAWYADEISKAVRAGILQGDGTGNVNPEDNITRQEAAVVLSRVFNVKASNTQAVDGFKDSEDIAFWALDAVSAMVENGYISGRTSSTIAPLDNSTRAESIKMIDNIMGTLINEEGTYDKSIDGNLVVNTEDVILENMTIDGNLYLTPGIGDGTVTLEGVTVKGETFVSGGGEDSIIISNSSLEGTLFVAKIGGKVRVFTTGSSEIAKAVLNSGAKLQAEDLTGSGFKEVEISGEISEDEEIIFEGDFEDVIVASPGANINVISGTIANL